MTRWISCSYDRLFVSDWLYLFVGLDVDVGDSAEEMAEQEVVVALGGEPELQTALRGQVTGDVTQIDLPRGKDSGLKHVIGVLENVNGISFTFFKSQDVVRHSLVGRILDAYEDSENRDNA